MIIVSGLFPLIFMQLETQFGKEFQCTPAFWAKMSTRKLTRELNKSTVTDCKGMSFHDDVLCWIKERLDVDASDVIQDVITLPLQDQLLKINCTCTPFSL